MVVEGRHVESGLDMIAHHILYIENTVDDLQVWFVDQLRLEGC